MPTSALGPLLEEPGLVHHQHPASVTQVLGDIAAHIITQLVRVPAGGSHQPLHPIRGGLPGMLGQLPAVLARHITKQPPRTRQPAGGPPGGQPVGRSAPTAARTPPPTPRPRPGSAASPAPLHLRKRADYPIKSAAVVPVRPASDRQVPEPPSSASRSRDRPSGRIHSGTHGLSDRPPPSAAPRSDRLPDRLATLKVAGQTRCLLMWSGRLTLPRPPRT